MVHNVVNFDVVQIENAFKHFAFFLDFFALIHVYRAADFGNGGVFAVFARGLKFEQAESKIDDFLEYVSQRRKDGNPEIDHRRDDQSNGVGVFYRIAFGQHVGINKNQNSHNNRSVSDAFAAKQADEDAGCQRGGHGVEQVGTEQGCDNKFVAVFEQAVDGFGFGIMLVFSWSSIKACDAPVKAVSDPEKKAERRRKAMTAAIEIIIFYPSESRLWLQQPVGRCCQPVLRGFRRQCRPANNRGILH